MHLKEVNEKYVSEYIFSLVLLILPANSLVND